MKPLPLVLLIAGAVLSLAGPLTGLAVTVFIMAMTFKHLQQTGIGDPHAIANGVGGALVSTWAGLAVAMGIGLPLVIAGTILAVVMQKRPGAPAAT